VEIVCDNCGKKYVVDDSKLPDHGSVIIKCKNCSGKIRVEKKKPERDADDITKLTTHDTTPAGTSESQHDEDRADAAEAMEYFPEDSKTALIFCTDFDARHEIEKHLQTAGYEFRHITKAKELSNRFRYHTYNMIIMYQQGPEPSPALREILNLIANFPSATRRQVITILIMIGGNQHDEMLSFEMSMNMTISPTDLAQLPEIIKRAEERHRQTYRIFFECLDRVAEQHF
jgi:predicted Zn finger-like uncharacterized protein